MKTILDSEKEKATLVRVNKKLNKYDGVELFPQKVSQAKEDFSRFGMPDAPKNNRKS